MENITVLKYWYRSVLKHKSKFKVPLPIKVLYAFRGFSANEYVWYNLKENDYKEYISDFVRLKSRSINGTYSIMLDDKVMFEEIFRNATRVPTNYAWIDSGVVHGLHGYSVNNENIVDYIKSKEKVVLKKLRGGSGIGVYVIAWNGEDFVVNTEKKSSDDVKKLLTSKELLNAILCEYIIQADFSKKLYPDSTNTIRIVCAKKCGEGEVHIIKAAQRIGTKASAPLDNVSKGALVCEINLETGELKKGIVAKNKEASASFTSVHPDTAMRLEGLVIPNWETIKAEVLALTRRFPYLRFVAWDVLLTNEGFCIIEGNASAGVTMFQMEHGVRNEELGDIYRSYGIMG